MYYQEKFRVALLFRPHFHVARFASVHVASRRISDRKTHPRSTRNIFPKAKYENIFAHFVSNRMTRSSEFWLARRPKKIIDMYHQLADVRIFSSFRLSLSKRDILSARSLKSTEIRLGPAKQWCPTCAV